MLARGGPRGTWPRPLLPPTGSSRPVVRNRPDHFCPATAAVGQASICAIGPRSILLGDLLVRLLPIRFVHRQGRDCPRRAPRSLLPGGDEEAASRRCTTPWTQQPAPPRRSPPESFSGLHTREDRLAGRSCAAGPCGRGVETRAERIGTFRPLHLRLCVRPRPRPRLLLQKQLRARRRLCLW